MLAERDDATARDGTQDGGPSGPERRAAMEARYPVQPTYTQVDPTWVSALPDAPHAYPSAAPVATAPPATPQAAAPAPATYAAEPAPPPHAATSFAVAPGAYPTASAAMAPPPAYAAATAAAYPAYPAPAAYPVAQRSAYPVAQPAPPPAVEAERPREAGAADGELPPAAPPGVVAPPVRPVSQPRPPSVTEAAVPVAAPAPVTAAAAAAPAADAPVTAVIPGAYPTRATAGVATAVADDGGAAADDGEADDTVVGTQLSGSAVAQPSEVDKARRRTSVGRTAGLLAISRTAAEAAASAESKGNTAMADTELRGLAAGLGAMLFGSKDQQDEGHRAATAAEEERIRKAAVEAFNSGESLRMLGPPAWQDDGGGYFGAYDGLHCFKCRTTFGIARRKHHCRNCGHLVCSKCSAPRWGKSMLPKQFRMKGRGRLRVCDTCHEAFEMFRQALLDGDFVRVREVFMSGYVRDVSSPYSVYPGNQYPVHCAAIGGNVDIMRWLVDDCGVMLQALDSKRHTPLYHAAKHQHVGLLKFLVLEKRELLSDITDKRVLQEALYAALLGRRPDSAPAAEPRYVTVLADTVGARRSREFHLPPSSDGDDVTKGGSAGAGAGGPAPTAPEVVDARKLEAAEAVVRATRAASAGVYPTPSTGPPSYGSSSGGAASGAGAGAGAGTAGEVPPTEARDDDCVVCMERAVNTVLVPCGHCCICTDCASAETFRSCPVCRAHVDQVVKTFRVGAF